MRSLKNSRHPFAKLIIQPCFRSSITLEILRTPSSESHYLTDQAASEVASIFPPPNLPHPVQDILPTIRHAIETKWYEEWSLISLSNTLRTIKPSPSQLTSHLSLAASTQPFFAHAPFTHE